MTIIEGSSATFSVTAAGSEPLTYQWRRNGISIDGATARSHTLPVVGLGESGAMFSVVVRNPAGHADSNGMLLTVVPRTVPVTITTEPSPQHVYVGDAVTYAVVADGSPPLSYQWRRNAVAIPGATAASYTIAAAKLTDSEALFDVIVTNATSSAQSRQRWLIVDPLPPSLVDATPASVLVALGLATAQTGEQMRPGPAARAPVTLLPTLPPLNPFSRERAVPFWYEATWAAENLDHSQFLAPLSVPPKPISLSRRDSGTLAGVDLDRYRGVTESNSTRLAMDVLIATRSGFNEIGIGNWKFIGAEQRGFFAGFPTAHGSFIVGEPTAATAVADVRSAQYSGFTHGGLELELLFQDSFWEFSGGATATYDAATGQLSLKLHDFALHESSMSTNFPSAWPAAIEEEITVLSQISLGCTALVDPATNAFSCTLLSDPDTGLSGLFQGRFYGAEGQEVAGTFSIIGLIRAGFGDGMLGAVALKR